MQFFILSFIGEDRPGFVHEITDVVSANGGNWLESRMVRLTGKFAGLARVSVDESQAAALEEAISSLAQGRFSLIIRSADEDEKLDNAQYSIDVLGPDRPGILNETTGALADHGINLIELNSTVEPAAMSGAPMFSCHAVVEVARSYSMATVDEELARIGENLGVDIILEEV